MTEPIHAPQKEWDAVCYYAAAQVDPLACCLVELRDRVEALEAMAKTAALLVHEAGPTLALSEDAFQALDAPPVPTTSTVLTVDELADCLPANAWAGPEGYSRQAFARHLLDHPRIGPLLRGEGAPTSKRVVLPERPPLPDHPSSNTASGFYRMCYVDGYVDCWTAARAEVERQQQGGRADG